MAAHRQLRSSGKCVLLLNFCMYAVMLGLSGWAMNRIINHGKVGEGDNAATMYFVLSSLIAAAVGIPTCSFGMNYVQQWGPGLIPAVVASTNVAWSFTVLAMGFACKHISLDTPRDGRMKALEAFTIILTFTMMKYIGIIHGAVAADEGENKTVVATAQTAESPEP